jgi:hypothetical protein
MASVECGKYFKTNRRCLFDVPLSTIQKVVWPWYSFNGAFEATIADQRYFLSSVPRGAGIDAWYHGLSTGRQWGSYGRQTSTGGCAHRRTHVSGFLPNRADFYSGLLLSSLAECGD